MAPSKVTWALLLACLPGLAWAAPANISLPEFSTITSCVPFNVLVQPGDNYTLSVDADEGAAKAISARVAGGQLYLETGAFTTQNPIRVAVYLPATKLAGVSNYGALSSVYVAPGARRRALPREPPGQTHLADLPPRALRRLQGRRVQPAQQPGRGQGLRAEHDSRPGVGRDLRVRRGHRIAGGIAHGRLPRRRAHASPQPPPCLPPPRNGDVVLTGSYGSVEVLAGGISNVYVEGAANVTVDLSGIRWGAQLPSWLIHA